MYKAAVLITTALMVVGAVDYVRRAWIRETHPVPATWILIVTTMALSTWMYWVSPNHSWTANIGLLSAFLDTAIILAGVIAANIRYGTLRVAFDATQKWCLAAGLGVVVFWSLTDQPFISYALVQCIALIGYFATVKRLLGVKRSTEPISLWVIVLAASLCAIYPAWVKNDSFAWIYLGRAIPSTTFMVWLIARIKRRMVPVAVPTNM